MATTFDPFDPYDSSLHEEYRRLRAEEPVAAMPSGGRFVATYAEVVAASKDVDTFVPSLREPGVVVPEEEKIVSEIAGPRHEWMRRIINSAVGPAAIGGMEPFVRDLATELLDPIMARGHGELIAEFVAPIPATVIAHLAGVPRADTDQYIRWSDEVLEGEWTTKNRTERGEGLAGGHPEFSAYIDAQIAERATAVDPPDDFITRMLRTEVDGHRLSPVEIRSQVVMVIVAGNETTRHLIANLIVRLAERPELMDQLRADRSLIAAAVEESLRMDPPVVTLLRDCTHTTTLGSATIPQGCKVVYGVASANRDERIHQEPDTFRLDRPDIRRHVAFGAGPHVCPGAALARMEGRIALEVLLDRVARIEMAPGFSPTKVPVFWANGPTSLPATLVPA